MTLILGIQVANGSRLPLEKQPKPEYLSDDSSEDESEIENEDRLIATELSQHVLTVMDILADLYKLSFRIRSVVTRTKSLKPTLYKEIDEENGVDKFEEYAHYDHNHVLESFKQLRKDTAERMSKILFESSEEELEGMYLVERLAITITKRRRALCYWQRHAKKLLDAPYVPKGDAKKLLDAPYVPKGDTVPKGATAHLNAGPLPSILSGTDATRYDPKLDKSLDRQSMISYVSTAFDVHGNVVDLPPAPVAASRESEFLCPYCGIVCPSRDGKNRAWRYFSLLYLILTKNKHLTGVELMCFKISNPISVPILNVLTGSRCIAAGASDLNMNGWFTVGSGNALIMSMLCSPHQQSCKIICSQNTALQRPKFKLCWMFANQAIKTYAQNAQYA